MLLPSNPMTQLRKHSYLVYITQEFYDNNEGTSPLLYIIQHTNDITFHPTLCMPSEIMLWHSRENIPTLCIEARLL